MWEDDMYPMLLWVLVVGAMVSEGRRERELFVKELGGVCAVLGVSTFAELGEALKKVVWLDIHSAVRSSPFLRVIWEEVQLARAKLKLLAWSVWM